MLSLTNNCINNCTGLYREGIISYPDLLMTKPKATPGQIRFCTRDYLYGICQAMKAACRPTEGEEIPTYKDFRFKIFRFSTIFIHSTVSQKHSLILPKNNVKRRFEETESVCPFGTLFLPGIIRVLCNCTVQNGSGSLFRNVRRCSWRRRFGVLFLFCLVSFDIPSKPTTPQIFLISPSEALFSHIWMFVCRTLSPQIK